MKNVYDIRYEKNLIYVLPKKACGLTGHLVAEVYKRTAVVLYLYYVDRLSTYYPYMDGIPKEIDLYVISSQKEVLEKVRQHILQTGREETYYILKENRGRDISALLIAAAEIARKYEYVCFLHDKKEHFAEMKEDTDLWVENLWGNLIGGSDYIDEILALFQSEPELGVLAPPEPVGDYFSTWYGFGWRYSFEGTKRLAEKLELRADIDCKKPPITFGTALWFRAEALRKLFDFRWTYSDFDDEKLKDSDYLSYAIERIFAYVAQDAGFDTGTAMQAGYAACMLNRLQYGTSRLMAETSKFFPVYMVADLKKYQENAGKIIKFAKKNENLYLYGAGEMGKLCRRLLLSENISPTAFLVSKESGIGVRDGLPVLSLQEAVPAADAAVIITVTDKKSREEMKEELNIRGISNYTEFWE